MPRVSPSSILSEQSFFHALRAYSTRALLLTLLVLTAGGATAASGQNAAPNVQFNKKSVDLGDRGELRVNPTTRALELEIPLGSYPGRAGLDVPVTFSYSSKVWRVEFLNYQPGTPSSSGVPINNGYTRVLASYAEHSSSGWMSSLGFPVIDNTLLSEYYDGSGNPKSTGGCVGSSTPTGTAALCYVVDRVLVRMPDGATHELRSSDQPLTMAGTAPDLYSVDGSRLRYHRPSQTLFMPDGSRYLFAAGQYVDTNGNTLNYTGNGWTDTLGRGIVGPPLVAPRGSGIPDAYSYTPHGMSSPYVFVWKRLGDPGVLTTPQPLRYTADTGCPLGSNGPYSPRLFQSDVSGQTCITNASTVFNPVVLHQIQLPTGRSYTFTYNEYGEIDRVELPTGGYERYVYAQVSSVNWSVFPYTQANRGVVDRYVSTGAPGAGETRWQYSSQGFSVTAPDNTLSTRALHTSGSGGSWGYGSNDQLAGKVFEERHYSAPDPANNNARRLLRRRLFDWDVTGSNATAEFPGANQAQRNPRVVREVEILLDTSGDALARTTVYDYDTTHEFTTGVNQTRVSEYDYVSVPPGAAETAGIDSIPAAAQPLRVSETAYLDGDPAYRLQNILGLPTLVTVKNGAGAVFSKRAIGYDEPGWQLVNNYGVVTNWTSPAGARGNVTTVRHYLDVNAWTPLENACQPGVCFDTHTQYDQSGSAVKGVDALGNETLIAYSPAHDYAYPTSVTTPAPNPEVVPNPSGGSFAPGTFGYTTGFTTYAAYDDDTGRVTSTTDANGKTTAYDYTDPLDRLKRVDLPDGGRTTYFYVDNHPCGPLVETRTLLDASGREISSWRFFDGLGRPYLSESWDGQDASSPYFRVDTRYDSAGRVWKVSNPYRSAGCTAAASPSGRWTTTEYDALGRVTKVTTPDGARVRTEYAGAHVRVTDQANRQRVSVSDGLGRLVEVWEVKAAEAQSPDPWLESFTFPATAAQGVPSVGTGYKTSYAYDAPGNLRKVNQGGQLRFFMYDSLGRLIRARNPEQGTHDRLTYTDAVNDALTGNTHWSVAYGYDPNGNLTSRVDARNVETTYVYDRLNRNVITHYAGGTPATPDVRRFYDTAVGGKGRLRRSEAVGVAASEVISYDVMGRPTEQRQSYWVNNWWGQEYPVLRSYNKAGGVTSQTYPSGHTVTYNYDDAGRLGDNGPQLAFTGNLGDGVARTYASGLLYSEFGGVSQERFGTQTPLFHKRHYNVRGQRYSVRLSTHSLASNEFDWNRGAITGYYDGAYTWGGAPGSTGSGPDNNGNLRRSETFIPGDEQYSSFKAFRQDYDYDALNRLKWVAESRYGDWSGQTTPSFKQAYKYDRWGNRTIDAGETQVYGQDPGYSIPEPQFELSPPTNREVAEPSNRLYAPGDAGRAPSAKLMRYDAAGNLVHDAYTGQGGRVYDAENRMTEAAIDAQGNWAYYTYDADGRRVKRKIANEEWWQVYGLGGELLAEYRAGAPTYLPSKEYGYRGGELLVTMSSGDDQRLRRFAQNLYYGALQRDPTAQELQDRTSELAAAGAQGEVQLLQKAKEIARALFAQTSYETSPARSDAQYVTDLYYAYLHRAPDAPGLNHWTGAAAGGVANRSNVCDAFQESPEFSALVSTLYGEAESEGQRRDRLIHVFYLGAYGRIANTTELELRRGQLDAAAAAGAEEVRVKAELMGRELFAAQVSDQSLPAAQFVTNLYESFLQRGPDAGGLTFWTGQAGTTAQARQNVLNAFAACDPFRELARTLYRETFWLVADHLGTPRMVADRTGSLAGIKRHDYLPFGEELFAGTGGRATTQGYSAVDNVRQKFTGKERDDETKLDYFGARYYAAVTGRFASVDPIFTTLRRLLDPQQLNLYTYTRNNPLRFTDPSGMDLRVNTRDEQEARRWYALFLRGLKKSDRGAAQFFVGDGKDGYRKGSFYIKIDSNHRSDSKNFKVAQAIANDRSETANLALVKGGQDLPTLQVYAERGKPVLKNPVDVDGDVGRNYLGQQYDEGKAIPDNFMYGQTLFPKPSPDKALTGVSYAPGEDIEVYVWNEQAEVEIVATMFHELSAHVFLSNMGRNIPASLHMVNLERQKSVHDAARAAEAEAKENFKEP